jgi:RNA polymerase sigma-70 factor (ECF subfamily)
LDSRLTSRSLLERARANETAAWLRMMALYEPLVRHWCRRGGVAAQDVDDVAQEVFAKAFSSLGGFRHAAPGDTFRGWLHGVTRHRVLEHFRRVRKQIQACGGSDSKGLLLEHPDLPDDPDDEERALCGQLYRRALEMIRGEFEPRTWQMFWRAVVDGVPTAMVASELGTTAAAVRQARSRILRRLREEAAGLGLEPGEA